MKSDIEKHLRLIIKRLYQIDLDINVDSLEPGFGHGHYATNVAMQLAGRLQRSPQDIAAEIKVQIDEMLHEVSSVDVVAPGFINLYVTDMAIEQELKEAPEYHSGRFANQVVVTEYSDPNPFKVLHAGHLYTSVIGDAISNLIEAAGGEVHRVNYGGDVGLHVGKTLWAIIDSLGGEFPDKLSEISPNERSEWLSEAYVKGNNAYEDSDEAKTKIIELNKQVYKIHESDDHESELAKIYWTTRQWSYDYFDEFYTQIGTHFEKYYPESATAEIGIKTVKEQIGKVFSESDGAIVFKGEDHGLHTRVFINSQGLPTYETKEVGLILKKNQDYQFDTSVIITGNEQMQYMQVVFKALEQFQPELAKKSIHMTHGLVKLSGGVKMSSRKGNILRAVDVLEVAREATKNQHGNEDWDVVLGAVKYAFIKQRLGGDIIYDPAESVSIEGNSGPYLQYALARSNSILSKADPKEASGIEFTGDERGLALKIIEYPEAIDKATAELTPHHIATYLYELAKQFNSFYENNRILSDEREAVRLYLASQYNRVLKQGLKLLNINAPEKL